MKADNFATAVSEILDDYRSEVRTGVAKTIEKAGNQALKTIKEKSPVRKGKNGGRYKKGWRKKVKRGGVFGDAVSVTVYNATDGPLVHLLEKGHQKANGGRVEGTPHVSTAVEAAERTINASLPQAIEEAGDDL